MMAYHSGSVTKALLDLFPNINFDPSKLPPRIIFLQFIICLPFDNKCIYCYFVGAYSVAERRKFFEDFAHSNSFDPLLAENWYSIPRDKILEVEVT